MTDIIIDAGTLLFAAEDPLAATGLLVPYGVEARSNLGRFTVDPGTFEIPADLTGMGVHDEHQRERVIGGFTKVWEQPESGVLFAMRFADTPEGRAAAENAKKPGGKKHLSVEASDVRIKDGKAVSGRIFGAALVERPAFAGATLLAAEDTVEVEGIERPAHTEYESSFSSKSEDGRETSDTTSTTEDVEDLGDGKKRITRTTVTVTEIQEPEEPAEDEEEGDMPEATLPATLTASATKKKAISANDVFDMMSKVMKGEDTAGTLLAALTDIKISGSGQLPTGGNAVQPAWLGEVYEAKAYNTRYKNLIRQGDIVAIEEKGFTVATGAEPVQTWNGNKAELPSASGTTSPFSSIFQRWGVANDIAREFYDIPAGRPVIEAYIRLLVNSYARVTDKWTLQQLVDAAGAAVEYDDTGVPTDYNAALAKVIQAIDLVDDTDAEPTSVVVAADVWKLLRYTAKDKVPEYINFALNRTDGSADGGVTVLKDKTGTLAAGQVLGVSREAAHINELPGAAPLQLDALDIAHGGIDKAIIGYTQFGAEFPDGLVLLGDPTP